MNEVMITLAVLGIVAMLTIPSLQVNIQSRKWSATSQDFVRELEETLKIMNLKKVLTGHTTTKDFVTRLSDYMRIVKVCDNDELLECFADKVMWGGGDTTPEEVDMTKVKQAKHFGLDDWETELIGVQFDNGINGLVAYNPKCATNHLSNDNNLLDCVAVLYDVSGFAFPNTSSKDIRSYGMISSLGGSSCAFEIGSTCYTAPFFPEPITIAECETMISTHGIKVCPYDNDYWAGAVKVCGGVSKMPTMAQIAEIANYIYGTTDIEAETDKSGITMDQTKATSLGFTLDASNSFYVWSGEEYFVLTSCNRDFSPTYSGWNDYDRDHNTLQAVCLGD